MEVSEQSVTSIDRLCQQIGMERTVKVLQFSLPRIIEFENELRLALQHRDFTTAARCAHKAISSVRAYGTPQLEIQLRQVMNGQADRLHFADDLLAEFARVIGGIEAWLQEYA